MSKKKLVSKYSIFNIGKAITPIEYIKTRIKNLQDVNFVKLCGGNINSLSFNLSQSLDELYKTRDNVTLMLNELKGKKFRLIPKNNRGVLFDVLIGSTFKKGDADFYRIEFKTYGKLNEILSLFSINFQNADQRSFVQQYGENGKLFIALKLNKPIIKYGHTFELKMNDLHLYVTINNSQNYCIPWITIKNRVQKKLKEPCLVKLERDSNGLYEIVNHYFLNPITIDIIKKMIKEKIMFYEIRVGDIDHGNGLRISAKNLIDSVGLL